MPTTLGENWAGLPASFVRPGAQGHVIIQCKNRLRDRQGYGLALCARPTDQVRGLFKIGLGSGLVGLVSVQISIPFQVVFSLVLHWSAKAGRGEHLGG